MDEDRIKNILKLEKFVNEKVISKKIIDKKVIINIIYDVYKMFFVGYLEEVNDYHLYLDELYTNVKYSLLGEVTKVSENNCINDQNIEKIVDDFMNSLYKVREILSFDIQATLDNDPAAKSEDEVILAYPGLFAIFTYRLAHNLYLANIPIIPRIMSEYVHSITGIDIHPGAKIGKNFFIDHGSGIVIGETSIIGENVKIYQGVTIGAKNLHEGSKLKGVKRHPTIKDNVTIYANASILGGNTVIGNNVIVGSNVFITSSIPDNIKVLNKNYDIIMLEGTKNG